MVQAQIWPLAIYFALSLGVVTVMIVVSYVLGERRGGTGVQVPYECGIVSSSSGRLRYSVSFYLVAMFFVVVDVESVFIFAWAVAFRELGWSGFIEMVVFIAVLLAALLYLWRLGALDWGAAGRMNKQDRVQR
jgi:NADH-quinone oxidoreductase subunit A